jgi:hypothetical protein
MPLMAEETVKLEIEVPKDQIKLTGISASPDSPEDSEADGESASSESTGSTVSEPEPSQSAESDEGDNDSPQVDRLRKAIEERKQESPDSGGDGMAELAKSPLEALPIPDAKAPPNRKQKVVIAGGLAVAVTGLVLWFLISFIVGISVAIAGAAIVSFGTFVRP